MQELSRIFIEKSTFHFIKTNYKLLAHIFNFFFHQSLMKMGFRGSIVNISTLQCH